MSLDKFCVGESIFKSGLKGVSSMDDLPWRVRILYRPLCTGNWVLLNDIESHSWVGDDRIHECYYCLVVCLFFLGKIRLFLFEIMGLFMYISVRSGQGRVRRGGGGIR